jgi:hypothetical protein
MPRPVTARFKAYVLATWLPGSQVRILLGGAWILSLCLYILLSCVGRDLCDELIPRPREFYPVSNKIQSPNERHQKKSINVLTRKIELVYITMFLIILSINWDLVNVGSLNLNLPLQIWLRSLILLPPSLFSASSWWLFILILQLVVRLTSLPMPCFFISPLRTICTLCKLAS